MSALAHETISYETDPGLSRSADEALRPPKITQHEAAFLLERGPYVARLAAQEKLLAYVLSITTQSGEQGPNLPSCVAEDLTEAVDSARAALAAFEQTYRIADEPPLAPEAPVESVLEVVPERQVPPTRLRELFLLAARPEPGDWRARGVCAQTDPESFFPEKGGSTCEAKKVCQSCEVREECLQTALDNDERFGIWGGLSERERRKLKKRAV